MKAIEPGWSFVKKLDSGRASFLCYWHLKFTPEKPNSYIMVSVADVVALIKVERFHIVTHCYAASFSPKLILCESNNIFYSREYWVRHKENNKFWKFIKNEHEVTLNSFRNFAYLSSYLHSKGFTWKRDYIISQKLQLPQTSPRPS